MLGAVVTELIDEPRMVIRVADDDLDIPSEKIDTITTAARLRRQGRAAGRTVGGSG